MQRQSMVIAVKGILIHDKKVLIVQRSKDDGFLANSWEFPGGKVEFAETLEQGLQREFLEETSIAIQPKNISYTNTFITNPYHKIVMLTYSVVALSEPIVQLSFEHQDYMWATKEELLNHLNAETVKSLKQSNTLIELNF